MNTTLVFGTFYVPEDQSLSASYVCPSMPSKETMEKISFLESQNVNQSLQVTHGVFFGENIKRIVSTLLK